MLCPNCNSTQRDGAKFCDECGFPLTGVIARWAADASDANGHEAPRQVDDEPTDKFACADAGEGEDGNEAGVGESPLREEGTSDESTAAGMPVAEIERILVSSDELEGQISAPSGEAEPEIAADEEAHDDEARAGSAPEYAQVPDEAFESGDTAPIYEVADPEVLASAAEDEAASAQAASASETVPIGADLSGFDRSPDFGERLVEPGYQEPTVDWRDGGTMKMPQVEGEEAQKSREYLASSTKKQSNKPKIVAAIIAVLLAAAALTAVLTYQMQLWGGISIPDVVGMTQADATSVLEESGFTVRAMQVKSDDTEGLVLVMDPGAGSRVDEGSEVLIHISTARLVPDVAGYTEDEAAQALADEGFENIIYAKERSDNPEGTVLSVDPVAGSRAKSAQTITVKVAEAYMVPDVGGMLPEDAAAAISQAGLASEIRFVNTMDYPDGQVMATQPEAGSKVRSDTVVEVQVARARGAELEELTRSYLEPGKAVVIGLYNYEIVSLDSVRYIGDDTVAYVMTARPFTYILGETVSISARQISGEIEWSADNTVVSIS